jgi:penicillin-binding protein-related factor A (putative recombinase)
MTPKKLKGVELESEVLKAIKEDSELTGNRYGVMVAVDQDGLLRRIKSYPDLEGVVRGGLQFVVECKVCSSSSIQLAARIERDKSSKQLKHLLERAEFEAITFYMIHFNERVLKTKTEQAVTYAFPVHPNHPFWERFVVGDEWKINRDICNLYGQKIEWIVPPRCRKARPDFHKTILKIDNNLVRYRTRKQDTDWRASPMFKKKPKLDHQKLV